MNNEFSKTILINQAKLKEIHYKPVPAFQIIKLSKLRSFDQLVLITFFMHKDDWKVSFNSIANSFGTTKNRKRVKASIERLKELKYITETSNSYIIELDNISNDSKVKPVTKRNMLRNVTGDTYSTVTDSNTPMLQYVTPPDTICNTSMLPNVTINNMNTDMTLLKEENKMKENKENFEDFLPEVTPSISSSTNFSNQYDRLQMLNSIEFLIDRSFHKEKILSYYQEYLQECKSNPIDFIEYTKLVLLTKLLQLINYFSQYNIELNYFNFIKEINKAENYLTYINPKEVNYIKSLPNFNQVIQLLDKIKK